METHHNKTQFRMPLALNYSYPPPNTKHKREKTHYLGNYIPTTINTGNNHPLISDGVIASNITFTPSVHKTGFSPTVYRKQTSEEHIRTATKSFNNLKKYYGTLNNYLSYRKKLSAIGGFKNKETVIGLLNVGYIDIDDIKDNSNPNYPTMENLHEALDAEGLWHYVHPSASRKPNKFRVLYRRNLTLYSDNHYNIDTNTWSFENSQLGNIHAVRDDGEQVEVNQNLVALIIHILAEEHRVFSAILEKHGINSSGVDTSAKDPSMHSKHITNNNDKIVPSEIYEGKELVCLG